MEGFNKRDIPSKRNTHCSIERSSIVNAKWGFHATLRISLTFWLCGGLLCGHFVDANKKAKGKPSPVHCEKGKSGNNECTCPKDPVTERYVDVESEQCEFYYMCHLGVAIKFQCDSNTAFHPKLMICLPRNRIPTSVCRPVVYCPPLRNQYIEDPNDCTKFYLCYAGQYFHWSCPEGEYFDPFKEMCIDDRAQADACVIVAKINFFKKLGIEKPPP